MIFHKERHPYRVVIPKWTEVPVFIIGNNIKSAGITKAEYLELAQSK